MSSQAASTTSSLGALVPCATQASKFQKEMQLGWHGMVIALDKALESEAPLELTKEALVRNVYADSEGEVPDAAMSASLWLAEYLAAQHAHLDALPSTVVLKGRLSWAEAFAVDQQT